MSSADRYAAIVAAKRPIANDKALPDTCSIVRESTGTLDSRGNPTGGALVSALTSRCRLRTQLTKPQEQEVANQVKAITPYAIDLPYGLDAVVTDVIDIGARRFEVIGLVEEGAFGVFTTAVVEERF